MQMTLRWFGDGFDTVSLEQIKQIPGVEGIITTLYSSKPGEVWTIEDIAKMKESVEKHSLKILGIESVNIHDSIKTGSSKREKYIANYIETLENLGKSDIHMVCYNFMPVFDWTRSDLAKVRDDGSTVLAYDQSIIDKIDPSDMFSQMESGSNGFELPGWEPERMAKIKELFEMYKGIDEEKLFENLVYFLNAIMPVCDKYDINMAIHIDDPAWSVFGLPRIVINKECLVKLTKAVDNKHNGITLCTGSLASNPENDIVDTIYAIGDRIHFMHIRNVKHTSKGVFEEAAHYSSDGDLNMYDIISALVDVGFKGPVRPDHGRAIWGEVSLPGYGLYDRALGAQYLLGVYDAIIRSKEKEKC